ncbi:hypothetical protein RBB79_17860 [Tunturiibacter empetritectus]|uniref:DUF6602 domain-containing protein n=1 Tax=Tunturiibacter lichenicola TaxID=2051959 RepID=A0A852VK27_9BACT|nr:DUF6602 domain-containing protein [Edaphobacter lichenicola]NYF91511.1 hypothetical protein [Edaphobacter lichenicola]
MKWSLPKLMKGLHERVAQDLKTARETLGHPVALGDGSQAVWLSLFETYLPERYRAMTATVVDSRGKFSEQIDVVIYDRQYSPLIFTHKNETVIPAEAVYAVFESKQEITGSYIKYAQKKIASVRNLQRTSVAIQTIDGPRKKALQPILGGFLAFDCRWKKPIDKTLSRALTADQSDGRLDLGCIATYGTFGCTAAGCLVSEPHDKAATSFLLAFITQLQACGTVPAIDMQAYARWLV